MPYYESFFIEYTMNIITAIIPVRAGSTRLKNKNIAPFAGTNLLVNKINQLKQVREIDRIVVSSDSDLMLSMAEAVGADTHKRAPEFCDEKTKTFCEVVRHIAESVTVTTSFGPHARRPLSSPRTIARLFPPITRRFRMAMTR